VTGDEWAAIRMLRNPEKIGNLHVLPIRRPPRMLNGVGCGACCRQLVPITEIEARYLGELVEFLAQERQTEIRRRFADVLRRLDEADLLETLRHLERMIPEKREARCQEIVRDAAGFLRWIVVGEESPFFAARHRVLCYDHVQADVRMTSVERGGGEGC